MTGGASPRRRGDYFERQAKAELERQGWLVVRAGGSLGPADLMAVSRDRPPLIVSCKLGGRIPPRERQELIVLAQRYGAHAVVMWRSSPGMVRSSTLYAPPTPDGIRPR
jgi:Holliday junction resolvase